MEIYVKLPSGMTIVVECDEGDTFIDIENYIRDRYEINGFLTLNYIVMEKYDILTYSKYGNKNFHFIKKKDLVKQN